MTNVIPMQLKYDPDLILAVAKLFTSLSKENADKFSSESTAYQATEFGLVPNSYVEIAYPILTHKIAAYEGPIFDEIFKANRTLKKGELVEIKREQYATQRRELSAVWGELIPYVGDSIQMWIKNECYLNALFSEEDLAIHLYEDSWQLSARKAKCIAPDFRVVI